MFVLVTPVLSELKLYRTTETPRALFANLSTSKVKHRLVSQYFFFILDSKGLRLPSHRFRGALWKRSYFSFSFTGSDFFTRKWQRQRLGEEQDWKRREETRAKWQDAGDLRHIKTNLHNIKTLLVLLFLCSSQAGRIKSTKDNRGVLLSFLILFFLTTQGCIVD